MPAVSRRQTIKFSLLRKMVIGMIVVSMITYGTSGLFIFYWSDYFTRYLPYSTFVLIILLLGIIWSGILGLFAAKFIIKAIQKIQLAVKKAADGELDFTMNHPAAHDELRTLSESFEKMVNHLKSIILDIQNYSLETKERASYLSSISAATLEEAGQIEKTVFEIINGADRQATISQGTFETIEKTVERLKTIEHLVHQAKSQSNKMVDSLTENEQAMNSVVGGLREISNANYTSRAKVKELAEKVTKIGDISRMVHDFADQTHLLSLNASIEAARAGEHGKGFAVVASEIQKLAYESLDSVKKIYALVNVIQSQVSEVVHLMENQVQLADLEVERGANSSQVLDKMKQSIYSVVREIDQIYIEAEEQQQQIKDSLSQAENVTAIAQETASGAQEVGASIEEQTKNIGNIAEFATHLDKQTVKLLDRVNVFKI